MLLGTGGQQAFLIANLTHSAIDSDDWTASGAIGQYNVETLALPKVLLGMQLGKHLYELACSTHANAIAVFRACGRSLRFRHPTVTRMGPLMKLGISAGEWQLSEAPDEVVKAPWRSAAHDKSGMGVLFAAAKSVVGLKPSRAAKGASY